MTPEDITNTLIELFNSSEVQVLPPESWQVETPDCRLLVLLSEDRSWVRTLVPIAPFQEAQPFIEQILSANFDYTQEARYALYEGALWGVFQHSLESLTVPDFSAAVAQLLALRQAGLNKFFDRLVEQRVRQIVQVAKAQGQSLEATLQTLDRFYQEGLLGDLEQGTADREAVLAAWQRRLQELWPQVNPSGGE